LTWIRKAAISSLLSLYNANGSCASKQTGQARLNVLENIYFRNNLKYLTTDHSLLLLCPNLNHKFLSSSDWTIFMTVLKNKLYDRFAEEQVMWFEFS